MSRKQALDEPVAVPDRKRIQMEYTHQIGHVLPSPEEMIRKTEEAKARREESLRKLCSAELRVIDLHTHTFPDRIAASAIAHLSKESGTSPFTDGTVGDLRRSMKEAGVDLSVALPVVTNPGKTGRINSVAAEENETAAETGILSFAGIHPEVEDLNAEFRLIEKLGFRGIKLHPDYYGVKFDDRRILRIIDRASELGLVVITHAGKDIGLYPPSCCPVDSILRVVDELHPPKLVLAHMGGWNDWEEVEEKLAGREIYVDTAFALGEIAWTSPETAHHGFRQLSDEAFVRLARAIGTDRVLFGSDSPWAEQKDYVNRITAMPFTEEEKQAIFAGNARRLLGI